LVGLDGAGRRGNNSPQKEKILCHIAALTGQRFCKEKPQQLRCRHFKRNFINE